MIDIHCHILPDMDSDGPRDQAEVLEMGAIAAADGIQRIVATPHVNAELPSRERIRAAVAELNAAFKMAGLPIEVVPGAELGIHLPVDVLRNYTLNDSGYVLLECPHTHFPQSAREKVFMALVAGLRPIVAHAERNGTVLRNPAMLRELVAAGALVQVTAGSLTGAFGEETMDCARYLLKKGLIHFLASDAHSAGRRNPVISAGAEVAANLVGATIARRLVEVNPRMVLSGENLEP